MSGPASPGSAALDEARLTAWFERNVEGFAGPLTVNRLGGGQSNPTFEALTPSRGYILRSKPLGKLLPTAHMVEREFRVLDALGPTAFPAPRVYALCEDLEVTGAVFYVMDRVEGRILRDSTLPECAPAERRAIWTDMVETLAELHSLDPDTLGLGDFGKREGYLARQIKRWTGQYRASEIQQIEAMETLIGALEESRPADGEVRLIHGDFKIDNVVLAPERPEVAAVLDWELSTLGNPLADFSYLLMNWVMPSDQRSGLRDVDLDALGIPTVDEVVARYGEKTGRGDLGNVDWLFSYNLFRLAAICQGIVGRVRDGTANHPNALAMEQRVPVLTGWAHEFAEKAGL